METEKYIKLLKKEMVIAMGCTEPLAVAYAGSLARFILDENPQKAILKCSSNIIKNVRCVHVPNSEEFNGIKASFLLGVFGGNYEMGFGCISNISNMAKEAAKLFIEENKISVFQTKSNEKLHIIAQLTGEKNTSYVEIKESHLNVVKVMKNDQVLYENNTRLMEEDNSYYQELLSFDNIFDFANNVDISLVKNIIENQYYNNLEIAICGMKGKHGLAIGNEILKHNDTIDGKIIAYTAAASEARMCGCVKPVVINSGSGNQGLSTSVPIIIFGIENKIPQEKIYRALILANLLTVKQKYKIGALSAFCGVVSSCCSGGAGITYLSGGTKKQIEMTISNHLATVPGIICDGAKASCASKIAVALNSALLASHLALDNKSYVDGEGIIKETVDETIDAVSLIGSRGMKETDEEIIKILLSE